MSKECGDCGCNSTKKLTKVELFQKGEYIGECFLCDKCYEKMNKQDKKIETMGLMLAIVVGL